MERIVTPGTLTRRILRPGGSPEGLLTKGISHCIPLRIFPTVPSILIGMSSCNDALPDSKISDEGMTFRLSEPSRILTRPDQTGFQATLRGARYWKSLSGGYDSLHPRLRSARPCRDFEDVYTLQGVALG